MTILISESRVGEGFLLINDDDKRILEAKRDLLHQTETLYPAVEAISDGISVELSDFGVAVSMEQPIAALAQRNRELTILNAIAHQLNGSADLSAALTVALEQITAHFDLQTGVDLVARRAEREKLFGGRAQFALGPRGRFRAAWRAIAIACAPSARGDLQGAANVNAVACSRLDGRTAGTARGCGTTPVLPLCAREQKLGMLNVVSSDWQEIASEDLRLLETVGDMLGIAIERARLFERSAELGAVEERSRLAREIHDILGQGQAAVLMQL